MVRDPSAGEIIATSANQIAPPKFRWRYKNVLYSPDPPSSWRVEGPEFGFETSFIVAYYC